MPSLKLSHKLKKNAECVEYAAHSTSRFSCCEMPVDNHYIRRANFWTATVVNMSFIDAPLVCMLLDYTWLFCSFSGWRSRPSAPWCFEVFPWIGNHARFLSEAVSILNSLLFPPECFSSQGKFDCRLSPVLYPLQARWNSLKVDWDISIWWAQSAPGWNRVRIAPKRWLGWIPTTPTFRRACACYPPDPCHRLSIIHLYIRILIPYI